jgi:WXG100 family type VII secretion target
VAGQTKLTQSDLEDLAKRHDEVAHEITQTQQQLKTHIEQLASNNQGEMMKALHDVHENWQRSCGDIVKNLEGMSQNIRQSSQKYGQRDEEVAGRVSRVAHSAPGSGGTHLQSFMGG